MAQRAVQSQFAAEREPLGAARWEFARRDENANGDGQVEGTTEATLRTLGSDPCRRILRTGLAVANAGPAAGVTL